MHFSPLIDQLIQALRCLPGVGPKSAQRMALFLLERDQKGAQTLVTTLQQSLDTIQHCQQCHTLTEQDICRICQSVKRHDHLLCIVESPVDLLAIEQTACFQGRYFVLGGHLSPLDGIGPEDIGLPQLHSRLQQSHIQELILATNPTIEGEATAHYIAEMAKPFSIKISRIAHGVPVGSELEYVDGNTLSRALEQRKAYV